MFCGCRSVREDLVDARREEGREEEDDHQGKELKPRV